MVIEDGAVAAPLDTVTEEAIREREDRERLAVEVAGELGDTDE